MPELPEVETVMRGLRAVLEGRRIIRAETLREGLRWPFPEGLARRLTGATVTGFRRRGKYMLARLDTAESLLIHLGMSGRMVARPMSGPTAPFMGPNGVFSDARGHNQPPEAHEHLVMETADGTRVGFVDPRRFGSVDLVPTAAEDAHKLLAGMGPEPLDAAFNAASLAASTIPGARAARLAPSIKAVLEEAIGAGGSSLRDYVRADGELGRFQDLFSVYDREGQPCPLCPGPESGCAGVSRIVQSGRSTFYCARTQR
jgi:formamidopyrimidine-DNA glycosylase